jgi:hypothetical protein
MDMEKCVEAVKDPQLCSLAGLAGQLSRMLVGCVEESESLRACYYACLRACRGEDCEAACLSALEVALGVAMARDIARRATAITCLSGNAVDVVALLFETELKRIGEMECPKKAVAARVLLLATIELYKAFKKVPELQKWAQDVLLIAAPALATAHKCGKQVFDLEVIKPFVGEETMKRIAAAMKEGNVLVGNIRIKFVPVVPHQ